MADFSNNNNNHAAVNINFNAQGGFPQQGAQIQMGTGFAQVNQQPMGVVQMQPMGMQVQQPMGIVQPGVQVQMGMQPGFVNFNQQPTAMVQINQQPTAVVQVNTQPEFAKVEIQQPLLSNEVPQGGNYSLQYDIQMAPSEKVAPVSEKESSMHLRSLFLMIGVWCSITFAILATRNNQTFAYILTGIFLLCYYIDCCCAGTGRFVSNDMKPQEIGQFLDGIMASRGIVTFHIVCYHYETRTRTVYSRDANGNSTSRLETYTEKVITHTASDIFRYNQCLDNTGVVAVEINHLTRLHLRKRFEFADYITANEFHRQKEYFKNFNRRDVHQDYHESFDIPGFQARFLVVPHGVQVPCCMSFGWYFLVSAMGFSWFYRMWFEKATDGKEMTILKKLKI